MKYGLLILTLLFSLKSHAGVCNGTSLQSLWSTKYEGFLKYPIAPLTGAFNLSNHPEIKIFAQALCFIDNYADPRFFNYLKAVTSINNDSKDKGPIVSGFYISEPPPNSTYGVSEAFGYVDFSTGNAFMRPSLFSEKSPSQYYIIGATILIHEARHLEIKHRDASLPVIPASHVRCTHGASMGELNCDDSFIPETRDAGPYSYNIRFLRSIYDLPDNSIKKEEIAQWIVGFLKNSFNYVSPDDYAFYTRGFEQYLKPDELAYTFR